MLPNENTYNLFIYSFFLMIPSGYHRKKMKKEKKRGGQAILKNEMPQRTPTYILGHFNGFLKHSSFGC